MKTRLYLLVLLLAVFTSSLIAQDPPRRISKGVVNGSALALPKPEYPVQARAVRAQGSVSVSVVIGVKGDVIHAAAVSGHPLLRQASESAARQAKFNPTILSGVAVQVAGVIVYNFQLPTETESSTEEQIPDDPVESDDVEYIGIGASLRVMSRLNSDPRMDEVAKLFFDEFGKEFGEEDLPEDLIGIRDLPTANREKRAEILAKLSTAFRQDLTEEQTWQFALGEVFGDLEAESLRRIALEESDVDFYKTRLAKLTDLLATAPKDMPRKLRDAFNELVFIGTKEKLEIEDLDEIDLKLEALEAVIYM